MSPEAGSGRPTLIERIHHTQQYLNTSSIVATLEALVQVPSVYDPYNPTGNESAAVDVIARLLDDWGMSYRRWEVAPMRPNLVVDLPGVRPGPVLIFEGHTDVVTAGDPNAWSIPPFSARIQDGKLYGRGACDMKGGVAAMLHAARAIQQGDRDYAGTIRLAILADEEGMMLGARGFVSERYLDGATAAIICEPEGDRVCIAQKGAMRMRVVLTGKMAHGCMPEQGINPVAALGEAIIACRTLEQQVQREHDRHPLVGQFTLTPTVALGGVREQGNVIPATAELHLDIRTTPAHDHENIRVRVTECVARAVQRVPGVRCEVELVDSRPATETPVDDPIVYAACAAHTAETGAEPMLGGVPGSTDGTIFWAATGIPLVTWGPGSTTLPHQVDEWVVVDDVVRYARAYIDAALRYFDLMERY